jgi:hypothetical protein
MSRHFDTTAAFHELIDLVRDGDELFLRGARAVDDPSVLEGYRWLTEVLAVALDCYVWADPLRPSMVPIVGPTRKFGGDNSDAMYMFAPVDPNVRYRLRGRRGDACYLSITVYGGPSDGRWSDRVVATLNDRNLQLESDGAFEVMLSATRPPDAKNWIPLDPDSVALVTRDYLLHPKRGSFASWQIESLDPAPAPRLNDADLAKRFRCAATFLRDMFRITPLPFDPTKWNQIDPPYPVPQRTYGWAAADASYAMGSFRLERDEVLIIEGRSPECAFWNMCLWNPYLQTFDYRYEDVTINAGQVALERDGSWRIAVAAEDPGIPNWVSTAGHDQGRIWFRWFLPSELPAQPTTRVLKRSELALTR